MSIRTVRMVRGLATSAALAAGLLAASAASAADDAPPSRAAVGDQAPDFSLEATDGSRHQLSGLRGESKAVLVFFRGGW